MQTLVADVEEELRAALTAELERHGHVVQEVATVEELRARAAGFQRDGRDVLVAASWRLDGDGGVEAVRAVRELPGGAHAVVVVVGPSEELDVRGLVSAGATDVWPVHVGGGPAHVEVRLTLAEHYARLQAEHHRVGGELSILRRALDLTGTGFVLTDPGLDDHPIVYVNRSFTDVTGYPAEEVLGRNCRFLQGEGSEPDRVAEVRTAIAEGRPVTVELTNHRRDGSAFVNELHIAPVRDDAGRIARFVGVQIEVQSPTDGPGRLALERQARRLVERSRRRSQYLAEAGPRLDAALDREATLAALAALAVPELADGLLLLMRRGARLERALAVAADPELRRALDHIPDRRRSAAGEDPLVRTASHRQPRPLDRATLASLTPALATAAGSATALPLVARDELIGLAVLLCARGRPPIDGDTAALAQDVAVRAALALDNVRLFEEQREIATTLQQGLDPTRVLSVPGAEVASHFQPAGGLMEIGGDFFDAFELADASWGVTIGDVTGKGAAAVGLTTLARHTLRTAGRFLSSPAGLLAVLNDAMLREAAQHDERGRFATAAVLRLAPTADGLDLRLALGGHPRPLLVRADGSVEPAGAIGTLLGFTPTPALREVELLLRPGDQLVLYTDGISDRLAGDRAEDEDALRVAGLVGDARGVDAAELVHRVVAGIPARELRRDDVAVVVVRCPTVA